MQRSNRFVQCAQHLRRRIQRRRQIVSRPEGRYRVHYVAVIPAGCFGEQSQQRQTLGHGVNRVRAVAKTQGCARIERFEILGIDRNLAVFQLDIRRQADTFPAALLGQLELQRGDDQLVAVYQINVELPLSLAVGLAADERRRAGILQAAGQQLGRGSRAAVHQNDNLAQRQRPYHRGSVRRQALHP